MVTTRVTREFADQAARFEHTNRGVLSAFNTDLKVVLALQTDRAALDRVGEHILSTPMRMGAVLGEKADPILLSALAGDRALRNLGGLDSAGTEGEKLEYVTTLEAMAARASRDYVQLCQADPAEARRLSAGWAAVRSGVRSSFLREGVEAAEASFGVATDALIDRSLGRRPLVAPPPGWQPVGVMAAVARAMPDDMHRRFGNVPLVSQPPERWTPQQGDGYRGWDRFQNRFIAKGGIGRAEQLVRRSVVRVPLSRARMRSQLRHNLEQGPEATKAYLQRVASNPRRAATLMSLDVDPMVVAAALGPRAMAAVVSGQAVPENSSLARLCDVMARRDRAHMNDLRHADSGPAGDRLREARRDGVLGDEAELFVNRAWDGFEPADLSLGRGPLNIEGQAPAAFYATWQQLRTGELPQGGIPDPIIDRIEQIRGGEYEAQPQGWADVVEDYADLAGQDRYDQETGEWLFPDAEQQRGRPQPPVPVGPGMEDPIAARPLVHPDSNFNPEGFTVRRDRFGSLHTEQAVTEDGRVMLSPDLETHSLELDPGDHDRLHYASGQEARFVQNPNLVDSKFVDGGRTFVGSKYRWTLVDDPEIDRVELGLDGKSAEVHFHAGAVATPEAARWALGEVQARIEGRVLESRNYGMNDPVPDRPPVQRRVDVPGAPADDSVLNVRAGRGAPQPPAPGQDVPLFVHPVVVQPGQEAKFTLESNGSGQVWKANGDPEVESITVRQDGSYDVRFRGGVVPSAEVAQWAASQVHERLQRAQEREDPDVINVRSGDAVPADRADQGAPGDDRAGKSGAEPAVGDASSPEPPNSPPVEQDLPSGGDPVPPPPASPEQLHAAARARLEAEASELLGGAGIPDSPEATAAALESESWRQLDNGALVHSTATLDPGAQVGAHAIIGPDCDVDAGAVVGSGACLLSSSLGSGAVLGDNAVVNFTTLLDDAVLGDRSVAEGANFAEHAVVGAGAYIGQRVALGKDSRAGDGACVGPRSPEDAAAGNSPPPASSARTVVGNDAFVGAGAVIGRGADIFAGAEVGPDATVETGVRVHSLALVGASATVRQGSDIGMGAHVADGADFQGALSRDTSVPTVTPPGVQAIRDARRARIDAEDARGREHPALPLPAPSEGRAADERRGASDPDRTWADPEEIAAQDARRQENPDGPASSPPARPESAPPAPADAPRGADDPDRLWDDGDVRDSQAAAPPAPETGSSAPAAALSIDIPESMLTAPYTKKTIKSGEAPDINAPIPQGPDFLSAGNGRWEVVDDPLVSHLTELPDGGYRVTFHPGVEPEKTAAIDMSSRAHEHLMDQAAADRQQTVDEKRLAQVVSANLSREVADGHAPCDEDRNEGGVSQPVLVEVLDASADPPRTGAVELTDLSGQALRCWMRDQDPEVYTPEFVTAAQVEAVGGKLKTDAEGVEIVRYFARDLQPFGKDGKVDLEAEAVTVTASEKVTVYNLGKSVESEPAGPKKALVRQDARRPTPPGATVADISRASGAKVVEKAGAPLGYSAQDGTLNISAERAEKARLSESQLNGKALYGAALAKLAADGLSVKEARGMAYVAAERLASKLDVPYTPVKLDAANRRRLVKNLRDPDFALKATRQADALTRVLVRDAQQRARGQSRPDSTVPAGPAPPQRPRPPKPSPDRGAAPPAR